MRVVFVDDNQDELAHLRQLLSTSVAHWNTHYLTNAAAALALVEQNEVDVVVCDMSMPGMDGAELCRQLRSSHPGVVRMIMSSKAEMPRVMRIVSIAHQFVAKPVDPSGLILTISRASELHSRLKNPVLRKVVGEIGSLPSPPMVVMELNSTLARPEANVSDVVHIVRDDVAISAKILQMVNSAYFGLSHHMVDIRDAVAYLGLDTVRNLTLAVEVFRTISDERDVESGVVEEIQSHSAAVANLARELVIEKSLVHDAFVGALLHDVGHLAIATRMPQQFREIREKMAVGDRDLLSIEREVLGATHADVGAYLLQLWGLPYRIIETVARHHEAPDMVDTGMDAVHATYIAEHLLSLEHGPAEGFWELSQPEIALDPAYLEALGMTERVASWSAFQSGALY